MSNVKIPESAVNFNNWKKVIRFPPVFLSIGLGTQFDLGSDCIWHLTSHVNVGLSQKCFWAWRKGGIWETLQKPKECKWETSQTLAVLSQQWLWELPSPTLWHSLTCIVGIFTLYVGGGEGSGESSEKACHLRCMKSIITCYWWLDRRIISNHLTQGATTFLHWATSECFAITVHFMRGGIRNHPFPFSPTSFPSCTGMRIQRKGWSKMLTFA